VNLDRYVTSCSALQPWPDWYLPYITAGFERLDACLPLRLCRDPRANEKSLPLDCISPREVLALFMIEVPNCQLERFREWRRWHLTINGVPIHFWESALAS